MENFLTENPESSVLIINTLLVMTCLLVLLMLAISITSLVKSIKSKKHFLKDMKVGDKCRISLQYQSPKNVYEILDIDKETGDVVVKLKIHRDFIFPILNKK
jgi:hypothetical protein